MTAHSLSRLNQEGVRAAFSRAAPAYDTYAALQRRVLESCARRAAECFAPGELVLDAGCGTGRLRETRDAVDGAWRLVPIDIATGMCVKAKALVGLSVTADMARLPFSDHAFGGIVCSLALHWLNDASEGLREFARVLKPSGAAVVAVPVSGTLRELQEAFAALDGLPHVHPFPSGEEWLMLSAEAGLRARWSRCQEFVEHHPRLMTLLEGLHGIGAGNRMAARRRGLSTPGYFSRLEEVYAKRFSDPEGLRATWRVLLLELGRA